MPDRDATRIKLLVFDVDGVFTDGRIYLDAQGHELKAFHTRDGFGLRVAREAGLKTAVLSARTAGAVAHRMKQLAIDHVLQGIDHKGQGIERLRRASSIHPLDMAYLGDDLLDIAAMKRVGYPMAVADAAEETQAHAAYVTRRPGGHGAIREAIEHVMHAQGKWTPTVATYVNR
jgi:3-deoxy-D-manno-octulosonate 8-phosphate phosphatase (KDO 8-P phosphatase)